jgi:hypothetical protein
VSSIASVSAVHTIGSTELLKAYAQGWSDPELEGERPGLES